MSGERSGIRAFRWLPGFSPGAAATTLRGMRRVALFARAPGGAQVKTRLQPALPRRLAASLYAAVLADSFTAVAACGAHEHFVFWADEPGQAPSSFSSGRQRGASLGERLNAAFDELLGAKVSRALIAGSDAPSLAAAHLDAALAALERHDVVLGPATDGGYWAVGLRRPAPAIFRDIPWSTDRVLEVTVARARAAGLTVATAATLADLDTPGDLARLVGRLAAGEGACGTLARAELESLGLLPSRVASPPYS